MKSRNNLRQQFSVHNNWSFSLKNTSSPDLTFIQICVIIVSGFFRSLMLQKDNCHSYGKRIDSK